MMILESAPNCFDGVEDAFLKTTKHPAAPTLQSM